jgi:cell division protein FtsZ
MITVANDNSTGAKIKVIGVGGAGGNAINNMIEKGLEGVDFIALNTDIQDLEKSKAELKFQIGKKTTDGLGTGGDDSKGAKAVEESREEVENIARGADMVFVTAGMGGGTGTGGAPAVARIAKATGALVVGIATKPFEFEGEQRLKAAEEGLKRLKQEVDSCIVIPNQKLLDIFGDDETFDDSFKKVDDVLYNATRGISDIITKRGKVNVDFADVRTIMREMGDALMGIGSATGENRAIDATIMAINNPLLEGITIKGARSILLNIIADTKFKISELKNMTAIVKEHAGSYDKLIWGVVTDERMEDQVIVTIIATGFNTVQKKLILPDETNDVATQNEEKNEYIKKPAFMKKIPTSKEELSYYNIPTIQRNEHFLSNEDLNKIKSKNEIEDEGIDFKKEEFDIKKEDKPSFLRRQMD